MSNKVIPPKPRTFHGNLEQLPPALLPLTQHRRWVLWKWEYVENKKDGDAYWTKVPYQPRYYNENAKSNDAKTWGTYAEAILAYTSGHCDGIGYMLKASELGAIDLDHIRNFATGEVLRWAEGLFDEAAAAGCYLEWTVSGTGARIIGIARDSELHTKIIVHAANKCAVEFYRGCNRFITISGMQVYGDYPGLPKTTELPVYDALFDKLYARFADEKTRPSPEACAFAGGVHLAVEEVKDDYDLNTAGLQDPGVQDLIEKGAPVGQRSEAFQKVVWSLAAQGWTAEQIAEELAKHPSGIGQKYAGRLSAEVGRSFGKWQAQQQVGTTGGPAAAPAAPAAAGAAPTVPPVSARPWPLVRIKSGELPRVVKEAEAALISLDQEIYRRAGMLVRPVLNDSLKASAGRETAGWQLIPLTRPYLVELLCRAARFERCKIYKNGSIDWIRVDAPDKVAETYLNWRGRWKLPQLAGIVNTPFLRVDGSICEVAGYDALSHLLFKPGSQVFLPVPQSPTKAEAAAALKKLRKVIATFPFVTDADRAVALASMLTVLDRRSISTAPLFAYTAPAAGTGKSLLADLSSILAIGRIMPVISQGRTEEEFEKRLGASLLAGDVCISIDNCEAPLSGTLLCQALTQTEVDIRVLGFSKNVRCETNATIFATGNNLVVAGDLTRRCLLGSLDAEVERPELREFSVDAVEEVSRRRAELVVAILTILRAWHVARANGERVKVDPFGSFADWSRRVREALVWLGEKDPCDSVQKVRENDPQRDLLAVVVNQWKENLGLNTRHTASGVINQALGSPTFYAALMAVATAPKGGSISERSFANWLKRVDGKIVNNLSLLQDGILHGYRYWKLVQR
jgi:hypothetical protein